MQPQKFILEIIPGNGIHCPKGFVHQHDRRIDRHGPGHTHALHLSPAKLGGIFAAGCLRIKADNLQQFVRPRLDLLLGPAVKTGHYGDIVSNCAMRQQPDLLDHIADPHPQLIRIRRPDVPAINHDRTGGGLDKAVDHPQGGTLAAAGGPDQDTAFTVFNSKSEFFNGRLFLAGVNLSHIY